MSDCCGSHNNDTNKNKKTDNPDQPPKSFIGKYLYNLGKKDLEDAKKQGGKKGGCC